MRQLKQAARETARGAAQSSYRRGVTLIEMLVAIGIVAILMGLLVPGLGVLRNRARSGENMSNLRQVALGALGYANISNEWLPPAVLYFQVSNGVVARSWDYEEHGSEWRPGVLWNFVGDGRVLQCPDLLAADSGANTDANGSLGSVAPFTGYNYNTTYLGSEGSLPGISVDGILLDGWKTARLGARPAQVTRPEMIAFFGEGGWKGGANRYMRSPSNAVEFNLGTIFAGGQAFRDRGFTHVVRLDGHTEIVSQPREGMHGASNLWLLEAVMDFPRNGFLSDDDSSYAP